MTTSQTTTEDRSATAAGSPPLAGGLPEFPLGTHLVTLRRGYRHHGIYVGDRKVVHYAGLSRPWHRGPVEEVSLEQFAAGRTVLIKPAVNALYDGNDIVRRARSRLGEDRYLVTRNNCEHFCEWCIHGEPRSEQVEKFLAAPVLALLRRFPPFARRFSAEPVEASAETCAA